MYDLALLFADGAMFPWANAEVDSDSASTRASIKLKNFRFIFLYSPLKDTLCG
jgi:hypothetical protein